MTSRRGAPHNEAVKPDTWTRVDDFITERLVHPDPSLGAALDASDAGGLPSINVSPPQGKLLMLLAQLAGAKRILEIGTLGGYSTIWLARALPDDGRLVTLEAIPKHAEVARANLARAGVADKVEVVVGPALESLARLEADRRGPFDLFFLDADKENNAAYFAKAIGLSRKGSLIIVDNVVRDGRILDPKDDDPRVAGTRRFYEAVAAEKRVEATAIQTVGGKGYDGFAIARVTG